MKVQNIAGLLLLVGLCLLAAVPVAAQADVGQQVEDFFSDFEAVLLAIATSAAVIGFIGLGILYVASPFPIVAKWKQSNPDAANNVAIGLVLLILVGSGAIAGMLSF